MESSNGSAAALAAAPVSAPLSWSLVQIVAAPETKLVLLEDKDGILTVKILSPLESIDTLETALIPKVVTLIPPDDCLRIVGKTAPTSGVVKSESPAIMPNQTYRVFIKFVGAAAISIQDLPTGKLLELINGDDSEQMLFCTSFDHFQRLCNQDDGQSIPVLIEEIAQAIVPKKKIVWMV